MEKKSRSLIATASLFVLLCVSGCTKSGSSSGGNNNNNNGGGTTSVSNLVASFTNTNSSTGASTTYTYSYDSQNRLIQLQISDGTPTSTFTYGTGTVTRTQGTTTTIYTLNAAGFVASDNQGNTYTYDDNGYLVNETNSDGASTINTISNGNVTSSVQTTSTGTTTMYSYTFITNPNTLLNGVTFLGTPDKSLVQTEGINGISYPFSYTYDSHGRASTETIVSGSTKLIRTYTYVN
jgi:YD repeat-containing protein